MSPRPRISRILRNWGLPGSMVRASIQGEDLASVTDVAFSGFGVTGTILDTPRHHALEVGVSITGDAAPGPRVVALRFVHDGVRQGATSQTVFHVLAPSASSGVGIGSHLI
jgi:hypothetical protein